MNAIILISAMVLWGFLHSLLASNKIKNLLRFRLGESKYQYYRLFYNIFAGISFLPILWLMFVLPDTQLYSIPKPWTFITLLIQFLSLCFLVIGLKQTGALKFLGLNVLTGSREINTKGLIIKGLYKYVRHPLYSSGLVLMWLSPTMSKNLLLVSICLSIYIVIGAIFEERKLLIEFGDEYREYKNNVPMLIPFLKWNL